MKKTYLLLTGLMLIVVTLTAQTSSNQDYAYFSSRINRQGEIKNELVTHEGRIKEEITPFTAPLELADLWREDSTISYYILSEIDSAAFEKVNYFYDETNQTITDVHQTWNDTSGEWVNTAKSFLTYNHDGFVVQSVSFEWSLNRWKETRKYEFEYNQNNQSVRQSYFVWDVDSEQWIKDARVEFGYNVQGLQNLFLLYSGNHELDIWEVIEKDEISYNSNGLKTENVTFRWNESNGTWDNYTKLTYNYSGSYSTTTEHYWESNQWLIFSRYDYYQMDSITQVTEFYLLQEDSTMLLKYKHKSISKVDEDGIEFFNAYYEYSTYISGWSGISKWESLKNEQGQYYLRIVYQSDGGENWLPKSKTQFAYNSQQIPYYYSTWYWSFSGGWVKSRSHTTYYHNISSIDYNTSFKDLITVFPNPVVDYISVNTDNVEACAIDYKIYAVNGYKVANGSLPSCQRAIGVQKLLPGVYIMEVYIGKKRCQTKFVKL